MGENLLYRPPILHIAEDLAAIEYLETLPGCVVRAIEIDGELKIFVQVNDDATEKQLRDALPRVLDWRDRLLEVKTPTLSNGGTWLLNRFDDLHREKRFSAASLARTVNRFIAAQINAKHFDDAKRLIAIFHIKDDEITEILNEAARRIENGEQPFDIDGLYPIDTETMKYTLRQWRKKRQTR